MQKLNKYVSICSIFNDQSFNDMLTNDIVSFEQLGPDKYFSYFPKKKQLHTLWVLKRSTSNSGEISELLIFLLYFFFFFFLLQVLYLEL